MCTPEELDIGQNLRVKIHWGSAAGLDYVQTIAEVIRLDKLGKPEKGYRCPVCRYLLGYFEKVSKFFKESLLTKKNGSD
jgi:hypothetical protein